jgi:hypothetical protein
MKKMKIMDWRLLERNMDYVDSYDRKLTVEMVQRSDKFLAVMYHDYCDTDTGLIQEQELNIIDSNEHGPWVEV